MASSPRYVIFFQSLFWRQLFWHDGFESTLYPSPSPLSIHLIQRLEWKNPCEEEEENNNSGAADEPPTLCALY